MAAMFLPTFSGPVLGVMMKQVCWHSRRSEAHQGLPEARPWMQNVLWRSLYAAMFLVSFLNLISGAMMKQFLVARTQSIVKCPSMSSK